MVLSFKINISLIKEQILNIGHAVRSLRIACGVSAKKLAEQAGLRASGLSKIECGKQGLTLLQAACVAEFLGISTDDIVRVAKEMDSPENKKAITEIADAQKRLTELRKDFSEKQKQAHR